MSPEHMHELFRSDEIEPDDGVDTTGMSTVEILREIRDSIAERQTANEINYALGNTPCTKPDILVGCRLANDDAIRLLDAYLIELEEGE